MNQYRVEFTTRDAETGDPTNRTYSTAADTLEEVQDRIMKKFGTDYTINTFSVKVMEEV